MSDDESVPSEATDEHYVIHRQFEEVHHQGVPRCDLRLNIRGPKGRQVSCRALLDTGSSKTIVEGTALLEAAGIKTVKAPTIKYSTKKGTFSTNKEAIITAVFPQFSKHRLLEFKAQVDDRKLVPESPYDIILGRDFLQQFNIRLDFSTPTPTIQWDELTIDMVYAVETNDDESMSTKLSTKINNSTHLSTDQRQAVHATLKQFSSLFTETIGLARGVDPIQLELTDSKPIHCRPIPIPQSKVLEVKRDIQELCELGVLEPIPPSRWAFPSFIVPKKDGSARVVTDFRKLNQILLRKPFPIPTLHELVHSLHGFTFVTTIDLHKGYYHFLLSRPSQELCTTVLPWGYYRYKRLPMGISIAADVFQYEISKVFIDLHFVLVYFDDILIYTKGNFDDHITKLRQVLSRLQAAALQVNLNKCQFVIQTVDYLGYTLTRAGFKPQVNKVAAILQLQAPRTVKQVRKFLGFINFYKDFIEQRSTILQPIVNLTKKNTVFKWTSVHEKAFYDIKQALAKDTLLNYPNPNVPFDIYADASDTAIAVAIFQNSKPVSFFSQTLSQSQRNYTVTQKETLALVKGLQANRNILLGRVVNIYTDHKNITFLTSSNPQTLRWRLAIAEYNPKLNWIEGNSNIVADFLSRYPINDQPDEIDPYEIFAIEEDNNLFDQCPVDYKIIYQQQQRDQPLQLLLQQGIYKSKTYHRYSLAIMSTKEGSRIVVPATLQTPLVKWYHQFLAHPGITRLEATIRQQFTFKGLSTKVLETVQTCERCQRVKLPKLRYCMGKYL